MTDYTAYEIILEKGESPIPLCQEKFKEIIRKGDPKNRNFRVFQINKHNQLALILERGNGIEKRYNPKYGYLIYQFMIGRENKFLHGKMYFPGQTRTSKVLEAEEKHTVEIMRFGRSYDNQRILVEYY